MSQLLKIHNLLNYRLAISYRKEQRSGSRFLSSLANLKPNIVHYCAHTPEYWNVPQPRINHGLQLLRSCLPRLLNSLAPENIDISLCSSTKLYGGFSCLWKITFCNVSVSFLLPCNPLCLHLWHIATVRCSCLFLVSCTSFSSVFFSVFLSLHFFFLLFVLCAAAACQNGFLG